ncbi:TetR/AcrR family transcriptional regulator [Nocardia callitridis]|uniref:TetR/AcrR family transcriptional regulator n=1 Tax=Nocardia callitridis TaxID=648753 RepID=A0ABP9KPS2_9NOCA
MARPRMARGDRREQLVAVSWSLVRTEGADALTLGRLAEWAEVSKPVVYSHFSSRSDLLVALYDEFDTRQAGALEADLAEAEVTLRGRAEAIARSYVGCVLRQGRELVGILAALEGSPELEKLKRESEHAYVERCREVLAPLVDSRSVSWATMVAIFGAAEALSLAAADAALSAEDATRELADVIIAVVGNPA